MSATQSLDNPLWRFSLAVYGSDGVDAECLALQDRFGVDINLLLYAAYAGAEGIALERADIAAASSVVRGWHHEIVKPLRQARRGLKPAALDRNSPLRAENSALRAQIKSAELEAEKIEQATLWHWFRSQNADKPRDDSARALALNLRALLAFYDVPNDQAALDLALPRLIAASQSSGL